MNELYEKIFAKVNTNIIVQVQSYGRVFIYDQLGEVVEEADAICITSEFNSENKESMIKRGLEEFYSRIE